MPQCLVVKAGDGSEVPSVLEAARPDRKPLAIGDDGLRFYKSLAVRVMPWVSHHQPQQDGVLSRVDGGCVCVQILGCSSKLNSLEVGPADSSEIKWVGFEEREDTEDEERSNFEASRFGLGDGQRLVMFTGMRNTEMRGKRGVQFWKHLV